MPRVLKGNTTANHRYCQTKKCPRGISDGIEEAAK